MLLFQIWLVGKTSEQWRLNYGTLRQGSATYGPRAGFGPPKHFTRRATFYCRPARDLLTLFFGIRHQLGQKKAWISGEGLFLGLRHQLGRKKPRMSGEDLFFGLGHQFGLKKAWISGEDLSFLVRWNDGGPLEPC